MTMNGVNGRVSVYYLILLILFALQAAGCAAGSAAAGTVQPVPVARQVAPEAKDLDYQMQPGDILDIKFYYNSDLNEQVTIRPDGKITLQLVDQIRAAGLTTDQLKDELTEKYSKKVRHPEIAVIVKQCANQKVFVGGEVNSPGLITFTGNLTAIQAIFQAGGFKNTAEISSVVILRDNPGDKPIFMTRDLRGDLAGKGTRNDLLLKPYDIVFLPKTLIAKLNLFVDQYIEKLFPVSKSFGFNYVYSLNPTVTVQ